MPFKSPTSLALAVALAAAGSTALAEGIDSSKLKINGFATAGASFATKDFNGIYLGSAFEPTAGVDQDGSYNNDNVLGIQLSYALDDSFDLVGQLVATGRSDYQTAADWAYIAYRYNDRLRLRAGRFAAPYFMYSESLKVGQAYPWARTPSELYAGIPVSSTDGFDALYRQPLGDWNLDFQLTLGGSAEEYAKVKNTHGLNISLSNGSLTLRAGYSASNIDLNLGKNPFGSSTAQLGYLFNTYGVDLDARNGDASFADVGTIYDDGDWFLAAEYGQLRLEGFLPDTDAGYVSVGHYFGKWLPYVMFSKVNTVKADECIAALAPAVTNAFASSIPNGMTVAGAAYVSCQGTEQTSYTAGFRYDVNRRVSAKLEVDHVTDFHNTPGLFSGLPGGVLTDDDATDIITFNVNAAF